MQTPRWLNVSRRYPLGWRGVIDEGSLIPPRYGIAYHRWDCNATVVMPIPLNLIVGAWRAFWRVVRIPPWRHSGWREHKAMREGYRRGYRDALDAMAARSASPPTPVP